MSMAAAPELRWALARVFAGGRQPPLVSLREEALKQAFRRRARDTHPDRARICGRAEADLARDFRDLRRAYETLLGYLARRPSTPWRSPPPPPRQPSPPRPSTSPPRSRAAPPRRPPPPTAMDLGALPRRSLLLAEFLHLSGLISWQQRIQAIVWQRAQRPAFGVLAQRWGYLQAWQVQAILAGRRPGERFGESAQRLGWLSPFQCQVLALGQRRQQAPIGSYFTSQGILTHAGLARALHGFAEHNRRYSGARR